MKKENGNGKKVSIDTILGEGINFKGELLGEGNIRIDGNINGRIETLGDVYIGRKSHVIGDCKVGSIVVGGKLRGNVFATKRVEILPEGELYGDISAPRICIADGVIFEGNCRMVEDKHEPSPS